MNKRELKRKKRHVRIKMRLSGTKERPRLMVFRSLKNFSAQLVDDTENKILFSFSTLVKELKQKAGNFGNVKSSAVFGEAFSRHAKEKGFSKVIFDRAGYLYHGRIKAFAEALRKGGLEF